MTAERACVIGASGGIGQALVGALAVSPLCKRVYAGSRELLNPTSSKVTAIDLDVTSENSLRRPAELMMRDGPLDLAVVATGQLHDPQMKPERSLREIDSTSMARAFAVNSIGPALAAKHSQPIMRRNGCAVFAALSARVGSIEDNRLGGWHSYRASKAALNMLVRTFSIEFARWNTQGIVVALHPGTVDTKLSQPFQANLDNTKLLSAGESADRLLGVIRGLTAADSGRLIAWDGEPIPF